jgi:hypothetical protein
VENAACESLEVVPGGLVLELNIDRARVTDTLKFRLRSRTHVECTQLGLPSRALTNVPKQQAPELHQAVAHPGSRQPCSGASFPSPAGPCSDSSPLRRRAATVADSQCRADGLVADDVRESVKEAWRQPPSSCGTCSCARLASHKVSRQPFAVDRWP